MSPKKRKRQSDEGQQEVTVDQEVTFKKKPRLDPSALSVTPPPPPRRSPNGYLLPDPLPVGHVLKDLVGGQWEVGKAIGIGGFGEIYEAKKFLGLGLQNAEEEMNFVVKVVSVEVFLLFGFFVIN